MSWQSKEADVVDEHICQEWVERHASALLGIEDFVVGFGPESTARRLRVWQRRLEYVKVHGPTSESVVDEAVNPTYK